MTNFNARFAALPEGWFTPYLDLPWLWRGRSASGVDCYGLIYLIFAEHLGFTLPDFSDAQTLSDAHPMRQREQARLIKAGAKRWAAVTKSPGSVVLMRSGAHGLHMGLYLGGGRMIHTSEALGGVIVEDIAPYLPRVIDFMLPLSLADQRKTAA